VCKSGQQKVHGVGRQEAAKVLCELDANPQENIHFTWKFNNTAEVNDIPASHFTMDRSRSMASYTPMTEPDYGTLLCWGRNDIGVQKAPCVFHVIPAGMFSVRTAFCILVVSFLAYNLCLRVAHSFYIEFSAPSCLNASTTAKLQTNICSAFSISAHHVHSLPTLVYAHFPHLAALQINTLLFRQNLVIST
jgi:hypothetical protein